jgi:hypothetical protein
MKPGLPADERKGCAQRRASASGDWLQRPQRGLGPGRINHDLGKLEKADGLRENELKSFPDSAIEGRPGATGRA